MANALEQACESHGMSSVHVTFCNEEEWDGLGEAGWLRRIGMQFHWENAGYSSFDDFLGALSSRKRKVLRRERRDANAAGLTFHALSGADITERHWDAFYAFYQSTVDRKWGSAYLTRRFFSLLGERLGDRVVLMYAENAGKPVAGALNLAGDEALYGRNWGCRGDWPFLHFELCYYRAIDWAIEHGLKRVEAGAQGRHKIQRGYHAETHLLGALDRPYRPAPGGGQFPGRGTRRNRGGDGGAGRGVAVPQGRRLSAPQAVTKSDRFPCTTASRRPATSCACTVGRHTIIRTGKAALRSCQAENASDKVPSRASRTVSAERASSTRSSSAVPTKSLASDPQQETAAAAPDQAAFASRIPLASNVSNNDAVCASVSFRCGGRMFSHRASPVFRATSVFSAGIIGTEITARRVADSTVCAAAPLPLSQFA